MNKRTSSPAVGIARRIVIQYEQAKLRCIKYQSPQKGSKELISCQLLFEKLDCLYFATDLDQGWLNSLPGCGCVLDCREPPNAWRSVLGGDGLVLRSNNNSEFKRFPLHTEQPDNQLALLTCGCAGHVR